MAFEIDENLDQNNINDSRLQKLIEEITKSLKVETKVIQQGKEQFQIIKTHDGAKLKIPLVKPIKSLTNGSITIK